jgi:hypothetical protein
MVIIVSWLELWIWKVKLKSIQYVVVLISYKKYVILNFFSQTRCLDCFWTHQVDRVTSSQPLYCSRFFLLEKMLVIHETFFYFKKIDLTHNITLINDQVSTILAHFNILSSFLLVFTYKQFEDRLLGNFMVLKLY